jgi:2-phosphosulfolactate phosphatase
MLSALHVHFLPALTTSETLSDGVVVVLDILRASTTITTALVNGANEVIPFQEVAEAEAAAKGFPRESVILGGERGGLPIPGFDCGNSPSEYAPERVVGKRVLFTTTNGTLAMMHCKLASQVVIGSFVNLAAVVQLLAEKHNGRAVHLLCAGTTRSVTREDTLCAGAIVAGLQELVGAETMRNDQMTLALDAWHAVLRGLEQITPTQLQHELRNTQGGRNLHRIGLDADIADAAAIDRYTLVPELKLAEWTIA